MSELLPCPWCGKTDRLEVSYSDIDGWIAAVRCKNWGCRDMVGPGSDFKHPDKELAEDDAVEVWNRRTPGPATLAWSSEPPKVAGRYVHVMPGSWQVIVIEQWHIDRRMSWPGSFYLGPIPDPAASMPMSEPIFRKESPYERLTREMRQAANAIRAHDPSTDSRTSLIWIVDNMSEAIDRFGAGPLPEPREPGEEVRGG